MRLILLLTIPLLVAACGGDGASPFLPTEAPSTPTPEATATAAPTATPTPIPATPTRTIEERQRLLLDFLTGQTLLDYVGAEAANVARVANNSIELEYRTRWSAQSNQPDVSYRIIQEIGDVVKSWSPEVARLVFGDADFRVNLTTYSTSGNYRYQSSTTFTVLRQVGQKAISYQEWLAASQAGFR